MAHNHGATANTLDSLITFSGCKVKGAIPGHKGYTLLFTCGWGFTFTYKGAFWVEAPDEVADMIRDLKTQLSMAGID